MATSDQRCSNLDSAYRLESARDRLRVMNSSEIDKKAKAGPGLASGE
jgi:hypothetical protein